MEYLLPIVLGTIFGLILERVGAADTDKIVGMLSLKDLHLLKTILFAIGVSTSLLYLGLFMGLVDPAHLSIKSMYWGVPIGGLILGIGWAISGYCPGTGVVAAGRGHRDALFFIAGGLVGAWGFALAFKAIEKSWLFHELLGGKSTIVETGVSVPLLGVPWSPLVAVMLGLLLMGVASRLPKRLCSKNS